MNDVMSRNYIFLILVSMMFVSCTSPIRATDSPLMDNSYCAVLEKMIPFKPNKDTPIALVRKLATMDAIYRSQCNVYVRSKRIKV